MLKRRTDTEKWRVFSRGRKDVGLSNLEFSDWYINQMGGEWLDDAEFEKYIERRDGKGS